jgi:hypothetical protein
VQDAADKQSINANNVFRCMQKDDEAVKLRRCRQTKKNFTFFCCCKVLIPPYPFGFGASGVYFLSASIRSYAKEPVLILCPSQVTPFSLSLLSGCCVVVALMRRDNGAETVSLTCHGRGTTALIRSEKVIEARRSSSLFSSLC